MASGFGPYLEQALLNLALRNVAFTPAATLYVGLSTTPISVVSGAISGLAEPTGGAYARVAYASTTGDWSAATGGGPATVSNSVAVTFPTATAAWGTVSAWFLADAATTGNVYAYAPVAVPQAVASGDTPSFAVGTLAASLN